MASEIKVDTIVNAGGDNDTGIDLATNDQILLKVANATKLTMNSTGQTTIVGEGGTTTTSVQQGLCKAWVNFDLDSSTDIDDSFNFGTITDVSAGRTTHTFTNNMTNADYAVSYFTNANSSTGLGNFSNTFTGNVCSRTTSSFLTEAYGSSGFVDAKENDAKVHGDLA